MVWGGGEMDEWNVAMLACILPSLYVTAGLYVVRT